MGEKTFAVHLEEENSSVTGALLNRVVEKEFAIEEIQHLIISLDIIDVNSKSEFEILYKCVEALVKPALVNSFAEERDYGPEDFPDIASSAIKSFSHLKHLLSKLKITKISKHRDILIPMFILCGTHNQLFLWSSENAVSLSNEVSKAILLYCNVSTLTNVLCYTDENNRFSLFKRILLVMRPSLTKDNWSKNPSMCYVFEWLLKYIVHPNLTDCLPDILPPSLMFTDHHCARYKTIGINCLHHLITNIPPTELKMYGRADVIYDALSHLMYCKEIEIVCILYNCMLKLLMGLEGTLHQKYQPRKWNRYDDVYSQLIWHMEIEDNLTLRREYSRIVPDFIDVMGITVLKYIKRSLRVFFEYLSISDAPAEVARINTLKSLCMLIKVAWPRMEGHCNEVMKSILTLVYDLETDNPTTVNEATVKTVLENCRECLILLQASCPKKFDELTDNLKTLDDDFPGIKLLNEFR